MNTKLLEQHADWMLDKLEEEAKPDKRYIDLMSIPESSTILWSISQVYQFIRDKDNTDHTIATLQSDRHSLETKLTMTEGRLNRAKKQSTKKRWYKIWQK